MTNPIIKYYQNGNIQSEEYLINGKRHNEKGPAYINYYDNGNIRLKGFYLNGKRHNENGSTLIYYYKNGQINYELHYINNIYYDKEMYYRMIKLLPFA